MYNRESPIPPQCYTDSNGSPQPLLCLSSERDPRAREHDERPGPAGGLQLQRRGPPQPLEQSLRGPQRAGRRDLRRGDPASTSTRTTTPSWPGACAAAGFTRLDTRPRRPRRTAPPPSTRTASPATAAVGRVQLQAAAEHLLADPGLDRRRDDPTARRVLPRPHRGSSRERSTRRTSRSSRPTSRASTGSVRWPIDETAVGVDLDGDGAARHRRGGLGRSASTMSAARVTST